MFKYAPFSQLQPLRSSSPPDRENLAQFQKICILHILQKTEYTSLRSRHRPVLVTEIRWDQQQICMLCMYKYLYLCTYACICLKTHICAHAHCTILVLQFVCTLYMCTHNHTHADNENLAGITARTRQYACYKIMKCYVWIISLHIYIYIHTYVCKYMCVYVYAALRSRVRPVCACQRFKKIWMESRQIQDKMHFVYTYIYIHLFIYTASGAALVFSLCVRA